jgi:hypothetical protein
MDNKMSVINISASEGACANYSYIIQEGNKYNLCAIPRTGRGKHKAIEIWF